MLLEQLKRMAHGLGAAKPAQSPQNRLRVLDQGDLGQIGLGLDAQGTGRVYWENEGNIWTLPVGQNRNPRVAPSSHGAGRCPCMALNADGNGVLAWWTEADGIHEIQALILGRRTSEP